MTPAILASGLVKAFGQLRAVDGVDLEVGQGEAFVKVNPVSDLVSATRALANSATITGEAGWTVLACLVVIAVFAPLSVRSYRRNL